MWDTSTEDILSEMENESDSEESFASPAHQVIIQEQQGNFVHEW